jgi:hypothetical protein
MNQDHGSSPFGPPYNVFGGAFVDPAINFRFEVWSARALSDFEMQQAFHAWKMNQKKKVSLKNKTFRIAWTALD